MLVEVFVVVQKYIHTAVSAVDWDEVGILAHHYYESIAVGHTPCADDDDECELERPPAQNRSHLPQEQRLPLERWLVIWWRYFRLVLHQTRMIDPTISLW